MLISTKYKLHEIQFIAYLVMAEDGKSSKLGQSKCNTCSFSITDDTLIKLYVHIRTIVINNQNKFHEIPFVHYLVMAQD